MVSEGKGQKERPARTMTVLESLRARQLDFISVMKILGSAVREKERWLSHSKTCHLAMKVLQSGCQCKCVERICKLEQRKV